MRLSRDPWKKEPVVLDGHLVRPRYDFNGDDTQRPNHAAYTGTVQASTSTVVTLGTDASSTDDAYRNMGLVVNSGTGSGQDSSRITAYNGTTKQATVSPALTTVLDTTSRVSVVDRY